MRKPRFMVFDSPSNAQSIDIEKWKKERNEEMKALSIVTLYKKGDKTINVNEDDVSEYVDKKGWSRIPIVDKPVVDKPVSTASVAPKAASKPVSAT